MGTTERDASGTGRTAFQVQPAFVLVGAPNTGKYKIADKLARDYFTEKLSVSSRMLPVGVALGLQSDYRTELKIAADRATQLHSVTMPVLYTQSLIDSLAYSLTRVEIQATQGAGSPKQRETWALTMATIGLMLRDTFKAEEIIFLRGEFDEDSDEAKIQAMIEAILDGYNFNYTIIEVDDLDTATDCVAAVIEDYLG